MCNIIVYIIEEMLLEFKKKCKKKIPIRGIDLVLKRNYNGIYTVLLTFRQFLLILFYLSCFPSIIPRIPGHLINNTCYKSTEWVRVYDNSNKSGCDCLSAEDRRQPCDRIWVICIIYVCVRACVIKSNKKNIAKRVFVATMLLLKYKQFKNQQDSITSHDNTITLN